MTKRRPAERRQSQRRQQRLQATAAAVNAKREPVTAGDIGSTDDDEDDGVDPAAELGDDESEEVGDDDAGEAPPRALPGVVGWYQRRAAARRELAPEPAERNDEPWTFWGIATLVLVASVLQTPIAALGWAHRDSTDTFSFAAYAVWTGIPSLVPLFLVLGILIGAPLARILARQPRPLRVLECLGVAACVEIGLIGTWVGMPRSSASYHDGAVVAAGALADLLGVLFGAVAYPALQKLVHRRAWRLRQRR